MPQQITKITLPSHVHPELDRYIKKLQSFDWHYQYSDDSQVYRWGQTALYELREMQTKLDPTGAIWMQHRPDHDHCAMPQVKTTEAGGAA